jgi:acid stress-induced BolA-like protein IbaG/YrbA
MMFGSVLEHLANLRRVKRCKTCVSGLNALFRGTEAVNHSFYSIGPKMMFGCVSERFANLRHVKDANLVYQSCVSGLNALFQALMCKAFIILHWTQNDVCVCLRAFR